MDPLTANSPREHCPENRFPPTTALRFARVTAGGQTEPLGTTWKRLKQPDTTSERFGLAGAVFELLQNGHVVASASRMEMVWSLLMLFCRVCTHPHGGSLPTGLSMPRRTSRILVEDCGRIWINGKLVRRSPVSGKRRPDGRTCFPSGE